MIGSIIYLTFEKRFRHRSKPVVLCDCTGFLKLPQKPEVFYREYKYNPSLLTLLSEINMSFEAGITLSDPRENQKYYIEETVVRRVILQTSRLLFHIFSRIEWSGTENVPESNPLILASNHLTNYDVFPMQFALPRPIYFMAKAELHQNKLFDALLRQLGSFPVYRGERDEWAMEHARRILEQGQVLGIFPEGHRSKEHSLRTAKTGAARLAIAMHCPLLPVTVIGTQHLFKELPRRASISIKIGKPIYPKPDDSALALTDQLMFTLAEMLPREMRGVYASHPAGF
jgi:1-acyl-sn-glycerol-3-phosphate acyltransferase